MINQAYPQILRPHVVALYRDGKPEAILVGRLDKKPIAFNVGYFRKIRVLARCLTFVYDPIHGNGSPENAKLLLQEVMNGLKRNEADLASLEFVPVNSNIYDLALKLPNILSRDTLPAAQGHESLIIPDSIDQVYRRMSSVRRKHIKASMRKLQNHAIGQSRIVCYQHESELGQLFRDTEEIAKKTYQRGLGAGFSDASDTRMRLEMAARKGWLRANLLYLGDRPVAFWIGMLYRDTFLSEYMGYDPEFRQSSPGMVLIMHVLEGFCARKGGDVVRELDFGLGHAEYKTVLCSKSWQEARVYIFSSTIKGLLLKSIRTTAAIADNSGRRLLAWAKLVPKLKRAWRDRLAKS
jgi:hypothetical protein